MSDKEYKCEWIELASGQTFDVRNMGDTEILIEDIAPAISKLCRYNGQINKFYSVAEHSVHLAIYLKKMGAGNKLIRTALLHDASEAYIGDMVRSMKPLIPGFKIFEDALDVRISITFNTHRSYEDQYSAIKECDNRILVDERKALMGPTDNVWGCDKLEGLGVEIQCWDWEIAENNFMDIFEMVKNDL